METIDHISARVSIAACIGALSGSATGMLKGHHIPRTAILSAMSCAGVATACLIFERVANISIETFNPIPSVSGNNDDDHSIETTITNIIPKRHVSFDRIFASHACGGILGGAFTGLIYIRRPIAGILFMTPIMSAIGYIEYRYQALLHRQMLDAQERQDNN
jgi:hypothetical protein